MWSPLVPVLTSVTQMPDLAHTPTMPGMLLYASSLFIMCRTMPKFVPLLFFAIVLTTHGQSFASFQYLYLIMLGWLASLTAIVTRPTLSLDVLLMIVSLFAVLPTVGSAADINPQLMTVYIVLCGSVGCLINRVARARPRELMIIPVAFLAGIGAHTIDNHFNAIDAAMGLITVVGAKVALCWLTEKRRIHWSCFAALLAIIFCENIRACHNHLWQLFYNHICSTLPISSAQVVLEKVKKTGTTLPTSEDSFVRLNLLLHGISYSAENVKSFQCMGRILAEALPSLDKWDRLRPTAYIQLAKEAYPYFQSALPKVQDYLTTPTIWKSFGEEIASALYRVANYVVYSVIVLLWTSLVTGICCLADCFCSILYAFMSAVLILAWISVMFFLWLGFLP